METLIKDKTKSFTGRYRIIKAKLEKPEHFAKQDEIVAVRTELGGILDALKKTDSRSQFRRLNEMRKATSSRMIALTKELNAMCRTEVFVENNIVPTVGRTMIANNLTDATPDNSMLISHAALGSSGTTPANGDTTLGTEVYRNAIASLTNTNEVAYATAFFNATETSGTYAEAGIFCDGTGSADTGILLSHVLISVTKSTSETLTIDWELTIS